MGADRISSYRTIRVLIHPAGGSARVSVLCRSVSGGRSRDTALLRPGGIEFACGDAATVTDVLEAARTALALVIEQLDVHSGQPTT